MTEETSSSILGELDGLTKDPKATADFSLETNELIAKAEVMIAAGRLTQAVDELLVLEKKARQASDAVSSSRLTCCILSLYNDAGDYSHLNEFVVLLCRKRGQLKRSVVDMVRLCMNWIEEMKEEKEEKIKLLQTLVSVTEGKIFVEVERARLTRISAHIKESEGKVDEAAQLLQEVQVETFGAMEKREKAEYVLDQMRLVLLKKDFVRCQIISRKLNRKLLELPEFEDVKRRYHYFMVEYYLHEGMLLEVCKAYYSVLETKNVQDNIEEWKKVLKSYVVYLLLSPFDNEQKDLLHKLQNMEKKKLQQIPTFKRLVDAFLKSELMQWPLKDEEELKSHDFFNDTPFEGGDSRWKLMRKRVMQHNLQVLGLFYNCISMQRVSDLLGMPTEECESEISELVSSKYLKAKIDRPSGLILFGDRKDTSDYLNDWSTDISKLLDLVEESSHLIQKERMINAARLKQAQLQIKHAPPAT